MISPDNLPHKPPFKFVDRVVEVQPNESIIAQKFIGYNEPCLEGHFPDEPVFPGVLIVEAMAQASGLCITGKSKGVIAGIDKVKFLTPVLPGQVLEIRALVEIALGELVKFKVAAWVNEQEVASARIAIRYLEQIGEKDV
ncbi:hypothetical protein JF50_02665 [Pseudoalteromonas luteoviolacea]|uniref:Beta-hydroxyacyl-ACP dehydratase n=1 Tax=Pseudoalteromonas luteoviolacea TaxID=43657 RepID=A0A0C1MV12_9GAMM|nr:3-hydroxyacyl-ACP dehydratase FabZ [Pseudoalteromonas luteoviolacea]KID58783.1 hypothetical protein JF50_02665 [Pseudoalteromonas luteoviolacea]